MLKLTKTLNNTNGFTIVEVLIGAFLLVLVCAFALQAFIGQNEAQNTQAQVSDAQQAATFSIAELTKAVRNAGYKAGGKTYLIKPGTLGHDTLIIYNQTDSTRFFLDHTTDAAHPVLMRKLNTGAAEAYAEDIEDIDFAPFSPVGTKVLTISITARTEKIDKHLNDYRRRTVSTDIMMPNAL